jgi:hypothetical protein
MLNSYDHLDFPEEHSFWIIYDIECSSSGGSVSPKLEGRARAEV